jgi:vacuolar-type H+-ATPase catalytic subunit A/Vma1
MANSGVAGYIGGGTTQIGGSFFSGTSTTVDKFAMPSDTRSTTSLNTGAVTLAAMANSGTAGYFGGGLASNEAALSRVEKFAFPSDTVSTLGTGLSVATWWLSAMADSGVAGYFGGGDTGSGRASTVNRFAFPSDTRTSLATGLSAGTTQLAAMADNAGL